MSGNFAQNTLVVSPQLTWVKLNRYCELSGETKEAVYAKRKDGVWLEGIQSKIGPDGNIWVNLTEVDLWVQYNGNIPARLKLKRAYKRAILKPATA